MCESGVVLVFHWYRYPTEDLKIYTNTQYSYQYPKNIPISIPDTNTLTDILTDTNIPILAIFYQYQKLYQYRYLYQIIPISYRYQYRYQNLFVIPIPISGFQSYWYCYHKIKPIPKRDTDFSYGMVLVSGIGGTLGSAHWVVDGAVWCDC